MIRTLSALILLASSLPLEAQDTNPVQFWTSTDGRVIQAKFVKIHLNMNHRMRCFSLSRWLALFGHLFALIVSGLNAQISARDMLISSDPMRWAILVRNDHSYTITFQYGFHDLVNADITSSEGEKLLEGSSYWVVIPAKTELQLYTLGPAVPGGWLWYWSTNACKGNAFAAITADTEHIYRFPYDGSYHIGWSYKSYTPYGWAPNYWHLAIDWAMPEGTPILAARAGTVSTVVESFSTVGNDGNVIEIEHDDGSFAAYIHLMYDGAVVEEGDKVSEGQLIGFSGNTGNSTGPHLHFHVWRSHVIAGQFTTDQFPVRFFAENAWGVFPRHNTAYKAVSRDAILPDLWSSGAIERTNNIVRIQKRLLTGLRYSPMESSNMVSWTRSGAIIGDGTLNQRVLRSSSGRAFFRWAVDYESFTDFPPP